MPKQRYVNPRQPRLPKHDGIVDAPRIIEPSLVDWAVEALVEVVS